MSYAADIARAAAELNKSLCNLRIFHNSFPFLPRTALPRRTRVFLYAQARIWRSAVGAACGPCGRAGGKTAFCPVKNPVLSSVCGLNYIPDFTKPQEKRTLPEVFFNVFARTHLFLQIIWQMRGSVFRRGRLRNTGLRNTSGIFHWKNEWRQTIISVETVRFPCCQDRRTM